MKRAKRILSLLLSLCLVLGLIPSTAFAVSGNLPFTDVNPTNWYYDAVQYTYERGMMSGTSTTTFSPNDATTRGMIVTILHRMEGSPAAVGTVFTDVPAGRWYTNAVSWASANGIVSGYGGGMFGPGDPITREQMAAILNRYSMYKGYDTDAPSSIAGFSDASQVSSYAVESMGWAIGNGLISGVDNNTLAPKGNATRAQVAMVLMRFCKNIADKANSSPETPTDKTYTVTFDLNYGSDTQYDVKTVKEGETVSKPSNPSRNGYTFNGWYIEKSGFMQFNFKKGITSDLTLYAHWSSNSSSGGGSYSGGGSSGGSTIPDRPTPPVSGDYTRGEWIYALANKIGMDLNADSDEVIYSYADIENNRYGIAVETAERYGILPPTDLSDPEQDVPLFRPDEPATREFAAYTAVRAMGFSEGTSAQSDFYNNVRSWDDFGSITYPDEASIAIGFDFLKLHGNRFEPKSSMTSADATSVFAAIDALNASLELNPEDEHDNTIYKEGVIREDLNGVASYSVTKSGDSYTVSLPKAETTVTGFNPGEVVILPANSDYPAGIGLKIVSVSDDASNWTLTCTKPELWEVYEEIDFAGHGEIVEDAIETDDGITVEYDPDGKIEDEGPQSRINIDLGGTTKIPGTLKFKIASKTIGDLKLSGSVEVEIPEVTGIVKGKIGWFDTSFDEFTLAIKEQIKIKGDLTYTLAESGYELASESLTGTALGRPSGVQNNSRWLNGRVELGRVPIHLGAGMSFDIVFFYNVSIKGSTSITYTIESKQGFQYKNGTSRWIFEYNDSLDFLEIKGSAKAGIGIKGVVCALELMDLVGIATEGGVGFNASFTPHTNILGVGTQTLLCSDVTLYPYWETSLDTDTVVGKFLESVFHYTLTFEHLKNSASNPYKLKFHVENCVIVPECTFGRGEIHGSVFQADNRTTPIQHARVSIYTLTDDPNYPGDPDKATAVLARTKYTDAQGQFKVDNLIPGDYRVMISATGYKAYTATVKVESTGSTDIPAFLMVDRSSSGSQTVTGDIMDAVTGNGVSGTTYVLRKGQNVQTGANIGSGTFADVTYTLTLEPGTYTLEVSKSGYITAYQTITVTSSGATGTHITLNPTGSTDVGNGILRVVLEWGEEPWDLDSHMFGPTSNTGTDVFHTYFADQEYWDNETCVADLDLDDVDSYGPETTTVHDIRTGRGYSFYVHDFTNLDSTSSSAMSMSGATVKVYSGSALIRTFAIPTNREGTVWHVFDYNPTTNILMPVNTFSYSNDPDSLGIRAQAGDEYLLDEGSAVLLISESACQPKNTTPETSVEEEATGVVQVTVTDTTDTIADVSYVLRRGSDNIDGEAFDSGILENGVYSAELAIGDYTLETSKDGCEVVYVNISVQENETTSIQVELIPMGTGDGKTSNVEVETDSSNETPENIDDSMNNGPEDVPDAPKDTNSGNEVSEDMNVPANNDSSDASGNEYGAESAENASDSAANTQENVSPANETALKAV